MSRRLSSIPPPTLVGSREAMGYVGRSSCCISAADRAPRAVEYPGPRLSLVRRARHARVDGGQIVVTSPLRMEDDRSRRLKIDLFEWERCDESARESCDHHGARCRQRHALPGYRANADPTHTRVRERRSPIKAGAGARRSSLPGRRSSRRVRRWPGGLSWAAGRVSRPRAHPGLAERPEIQDDERNDPGQNNRARDSRTLRMMCHRIRTCPPGQPPNAARTATSSP